MLSLHFLKKLLIFRRWDEVIVQLTGSLDPALTAAGPPTEAIAKVRVTKDELLLFDGLGELAALVLEIGGVVHDDSRARDASKLLHDDQHLLFGRQIENLT